MELPPRDRLKRSLPPPFQRGLIQYKLTSCTRSSYGMSAEDQQDGGRAFDGAPDSVPIRDGNALQCAARGIANVKNHEPESTAVQYHVRGLQRDFEPMSAPHP